jgi:hypothetical protein
MVVEPATNPNHDMLLGFPPEAGHNRFRIVSSKKSGIVALNPSKQSMSHIMGAFSHVVPAISESQGMLLCDMLSFGVKKAAKRRTNNSLKCMWI